MRKLSLVFVFLILLMLIPPVQGDLLIKDGSPAANTTIEINSDTSSKKIKYTIVSTFAKTLTKTDIKLLNTNLYYYTSDTSHARLGENEVDIYDMYDFSKLDAGDIAMGRNNFVLTVTVYGYRSNLAVYYTTYDTHTMYIEFCDCDVDNVDNGDNGALDFVSGSNELFFATIGFFIMLSIIRKKSMAI